MKSDKKYKVAIIDDHCMFLEAFQTLLNTFSNVQITGCYQNVSRFEDEIQTNTPDIIFMDVQMDDINGIDATKKILAYYPKIKVVGLSQHTDGLTALEMFKAGACGYLTKAQTVVDLKAVFVSIEKGERYIGHNTAMELSYLSINQAVDKNDPIKNKFTSRELSIIDWIVSGKTDKEIGQILGISAKTVDKDKRNIMKIMGVNKSTQIVAMAFKLGFHSGKNMGV